MKVVLVWAKVPKERNLSAPFGICYIASYVRRELGLTVDIIDANLERLTVQETVKRVLDGGYHVVGISFMTPQADFAFELTKAIKEANKDILVVHGGVHPTVNPMDSMNNLADFCVIGEGEITFKELLESLEDGKNYKEIDGLAYGENGEIAFTKQREFKEDLDEFPPPAFDLVSIERYEENLHVKAGLAIPLMASRGCPFNCSFCTSPTIWRRTVRFRSPENILDEIRGYIEKYGVRKFHFYDDNFLLSEKRMDEFCKAVKESDLSFEWICLGRTDTINRHPEILRTMKEAGCLGLEIGVETLDDNVLKSTNKKVTSSDSLKALERVIDAGMEIACLQLMTFNVGETIYGHYLQNRKLMDATGEKKVFFGQFATPYPGTMFNKTASHDGMVLVEAWSDYVTSNVNFIPKTLLGEQPRRTLRRLRASDMMIILKAYSRFEKFGIFDVRSIRNHRKRLRLFYRHCDGQNSMEDISRALGRRFGMGDREALGYTAKVMVIMSQLGLVEPHNIKDYPRRIEPDWQKRFYGVNSNWRMNIHIISRFSSMIGKNLVNRS
jgi:radical SAM superfamily enzyme YgiQ (UPF0313 family)